MKFIGGKKEEEEGNWYNYLFRDLCQLGRAKLSCCDRNKDMVGKAGMVGGWASCADAQAFPTWPASLTPCLATTRGGSDDEYPIGVTYERQRQMEGGFITVRLTKKERGGKKGFRIRNWKSLPPLETVTGIRREETKVTASR